MYIAHNIPLTRQRTGWTEFRNTSFPLRPTSRRLTRRTIRLRSRTSGCGTGALQEMLRQIQEIRTCYDFPIAAIELKQ